MFAGDLLRLTEGDGVTVTVIVVVTTEQVDGPIGVGVTM
jgi:hypothetical protein